MESLIKSFYLDARLLIAQVVNFAVVFLILYFFALKPITRVMQERTKKIAKSLADAKAIAERLAKTEIETRKIISRAKLEAGVILEKAASQAEAKGRTMVLEAKEEIGRLFNQEKDKLQAEKAKVLKEIKSQTADLVIAAAEKLLAEKIDKNTETNWLKRLLKK